MNFFQHQARARRNTSWLVVLFGMAVALIILACYVPGIIVANYIAFERAPSARAGRDAIEIGSRYSCWRADVLGYVAGAAVSVIFAGSLWKIGALRGGGAAVASTLGGRAVEAGTASPDERKLLNVVEEMAIASGVGVPRVFVLPEEQGINALAAGYSPNDAAVVVTRGGVEHLSRDELQGVVAHEFSHILNGDMRLNVRLIGLIHGILAIGLIGGALLRAGAEGSSGRSSRSGGARLMLLLLGALLALIGYVGVFFGRAIKAAICRQREFLADAAAVDFTRNPDGLAGALKKIGGVPRQSVLLTDAAEEVSHMAIGAAVDQPVIFGSLLATHPPLVERIRRIDPSFDGRFPKIRQPQAVEQRWWPTKFRQPGDLAAAAAISQLAALTIDPAGVVDRVGMPTIDHLAYGAALLDMLPSMLRAAARSPSGALAVVYALLLDADQEKRTRQLSLLREEGDAGVLDETVRLHPIAALLFPGLRLPMAELAVPALRGLSRAQYDAFRQNVARLAAADEKLDLFEFALQKLLLRRLAPSFGKVDRQIVHYRAVTPLLPDCRIVLSTLARLGNRGAEAAARAYGSAFIRLAKTGEGALPSTAAGPARTGPTGEAGKTGLLPIEACGLKVLDQSLNRLAAASPVVKERIVDACARCVTADGSVTVKEAELLRAVVDALDCPLPPFLPTAPSL